MIDINLGLYIMYCLLCAFITLAVLLSLGFFIDLVSDLQHKFGNTVGFLISIIIIIIVIIIVIIMFLIKLF